jgi:uncharacterized membrane protein (UPF0127 family)
MIDEMKHIGGKLGRIRLGMGVVVALCLLNGPAVYAEKVYPEWAVAILPSGAEYQLELAISVEDRARGYMYRKKIGEHEGMMFFFDTPGRHGFWMKNCLVSLDIIWIDEDLQVVHIAANVPPCPESGPCPSTVPLRAGKFVLEFAAGTAAAQGLHVGDRVVILAEPGLP